MRYCWDSHVQCHKECRILVRNLRLNLKRYAAAAAKSLQSCLTLCDPRDSSPPGSPVPGILQARTLEWVAISFSNAWEWKVKVKSLSRVRLLATPWTAAYQAPPSMEFSRQEYWSGVPFPSPRDLPNPGIKPRSPALQADALTSEPPGKPQLNSIVGPYWRHCCLDRIIWKGNARRFLTSSSHLFSGPQSNTSFPGSPSP